jgi:uncharacterized protein YndB with AHSA1/START domain
MGKLPRSGSVEVTTTASPDQVWKVLADVTATGDWSHETRGAVWLEAADEAVPGARFKGLNGKGGMKWTRTCEVVEAEPGRVLSWRTVPTGLYRDSTRWTYELEPVAEGGTRIVQRFEVLALGPVSDRLFYALIPAHRDRTEALRGDLEQLGAVAGGV